MSEHYYDIDGNPRHTMPNKSKPGQTRATTLADAKKHKLFPSVSAYLKMKAEAGLDNWRMDQVIRACYNCNIVDHMGLETYASHVKENAFAQVGDAADLGTKIHAALERYYTSEELPEDDEQLRAMVLRTTDRVRGLGIKVLHAEKVLVNAKHGYAGTTDIIFCDGFGGAGILDFKSKKTKPGQKAFSPDSHAMQIAAYWMAHWGETHGEFLPDAIGINVYISTTEPGRVDIVTREDGELRAAWRAFQACLELYRYSTGYDARVL
jgi:hypothetical protein